MLLVNNQPYLLMVGHKLDPGWIGFDEARYSDMKKAGFNAYWGNWISAGGLLISDWLWRRGFYWIGTATLDLVTQQDAQGVLTSTPQGQQIVSDIVNRYRSKPNLIGWRLVHEYNADHSDPARWIAAKDFVMARDPGRIVGELFVTNTVKPDRDIYNFCPFPLPEQVIGGWASAGGSLTYLLDQMFTQEQKWLEGKRFVRGYSTTPIMELIRSVGKHRPFTREELFRYFLSQVILNVRAYEVLWGPSQTEPGYTPEMAGWPGGWGDINTRWQWTLETVKLLSETLRPVILASGDFIQIADATPPFQRPSLATGWVYKGLYAAQKTVDGVNYIGAVNTENGPLSVVIRASGVGAEDLVTGMRVPIVSGAIRQTIPGLTARLYRIY